MTVLLQKVLESFESLKTDILSNERCKCCYILDLCCSVEQEDSIVDFFCKFPRDGNHLTHLCCARFDRRLSVTFDNEGEARGDDPRRRRRNSHQVCTYLRIYRVVKLQNYENWCTNKIFDQPTVDGLMMCFNLGQTPITHHLNC